MTIYIATAEGHVPGEVFSFGIHVNGPPDSGSDALSAWQEALGDLMDTDAGAGNTLKSHISTDVGIDDAAVAELDGFTGKQVTKFLGAAVHVGTSAEETLPPQVALVCSLRTSLATRAGRGRFYLPPLDVASIDTGRVTASAVAAALAGSGAMVQTMFDAGFVPVVYHRANLTSTTVARIDIGNVFDTQRRRRNKLVETRSSHTIVP